MKNLKTALLAPIATLCLASPVFAGSPPAIGYTAASTPYGSFGCKQRAENKLYSIGATNISKSSGGTIWADYGSYSIGVWCRGSEVVIIVAGDADTTDLRTEIRSAF